ncbi:hypothetical protein ANN_27930 [Periplaneta americana]|uniref:Uncharacterized protein n=1 Tax=Periplaneta americana TaxID=6978 RepID=A0ABQ8RVP3_PERAM|nr:hypothetical protein ANN_27930 [Periplaneta americana]
MRHIIVCWWNYEVWLNMMSLPSRSGCNDGVFITRRELYDTGRVKLQEQVTVMKDFVRMKTKCTDEYLMALYKQISFFVSDFKKRWQKAHVEKFRAYAFETAQLFVRKYSWYVMPPTIHKILIHGPEIIRHAIVPIGQLSEEAQEARNKEFTKYREGFSRKVSRTKTNEDVPNVLLISSDPIIFSLRKMPKKKATQFDKEVLDMLRMFVLQYTTAATTLTVRTRLKSPDVSFL